MLRDVPTLDQLHDQAARLLAGVRAGEPAARARLAGSAATLDGAQLVVARELGFRSWPRLLRYLALDEPARRLHDLDRLFQAVPEVRDTRLPLIDLLEREVAALRDLSRAGHPAAAELLRVTGTEGALDVGVARRAMARWHRFASWDEVVRHGATTVDPRFEAAADAIVDGDAHTLRALIAADPALPRARSSFGHGATLLHHVAANGIEESRQWQSPPNAVEIARILLDAGADPDATCRCYCDRDTTLNLLVSSVHPARAGVQAALVDTLVDAGAAVDGRPGGETPLHTALAFGYRAAAEALARRGARVDDVVAAAGLGRLERLRELLAGASPESLGSALLRASLFDHRAVVAALLDAGADLAARDAQGMTALHLAAWHGHAELVELLLARGAPLAERNRYGGTVLGMTRWAEANAPVAGADYPAIIARLIAAGAT